MIVDFENGNDMYKYEELEKLICGAEAKEGKVFVVSVTGEFRTGKSFFLGLLKTYLDYVFEVSACSLYLSYMLLFFLHGDISSSFLTLKNWYSATDELELEIILRCT